MTSPEKSRDQRVAHAALRLGLGAAVLSVLGALTLALGRGPDSDFWRGFGGGVLATLPLFFVTMMIRAVRSMDEYGRQLHTRAAGAAFLAVMLMSGTLISLEALFGFRTPAWAVYVTGMGTWGVTAGLLSARDQGTA